MDGLTVRRSIRSSPDDIPMIRAVFDRAYRIMDDRGYGYLAGIHGYPLPQYCDHGSPLFLPWHRAYLHLFEQTLKDIDESFYIPWWDWTSGASHREGIPLPYTVAEVDGAPNPLASAPFQGLSPAILELFYRHGLATSTDDPHTLRRPGDPSELPSRDRIDDLLGLGTYLDFNSQLESGPHNFVHDWCGATMGAVPSAAFDPIFWSHHAMIDRVWYLWQIRHPGALPPAGLLDAPLPPFNLTVRDVLDVETLGYTYAATVII